MAAITLRVKGMTCSHCAASVERALAECEGVQSVEVHLTTGKAIVQGDAADPAQLRLAVEQIGYDVTDTTPSA